MTGIGLATVQALLSDGCRVAVGARRGDDVAATQTFREKVGSNPVLLRLDVQSPASVETFVTATEAALGPIDILVNNAGISAHHDIEDHSEDDWLRVIDINLNGPFRMARRCIGGMKKRGWGRIVNVASTAAHTAVAGSGAYCASKSGLLGLTRTLAIEGAPHGVSCVSVSPTWIKTDMLLASASEIAARDGGSTEDTIAEIADANPQKRLVEPQEVAAVIAFACSEAAPALTMEDIQVSAGAHW